MTYSRRPCVRPLSGGPMEALLQIWPVLAALAGFSLALAGLMVGLFRWLR